MVPVSSMTALVAYLLVDDCQLSCEMSMILHYRRSEKDLTPSEIYLEENKKRFFVNELLHAVLYLSNSVPGATGVRNDSHFHQ